MKITHIGRMSRWQRWATYVVLTICLISGVVFFLLQDYFGLPPSAIRFWWIAHGVTSFVAMLAVGGALSQHVLVTWRARRGRFIGSLNLFFLLLLILTTLVLFYGLEAWHQPAHWAHVIAGLATVVVLPAHVIWGRTRVAKLRGFL